MYTRLSLNGVLLTFFLLVGVAGNSQTPGLIFDPAVGSVLDPNGDGYVDIEGNGFSNDGYDVDEFEIPMFGIPSLMDEIDSDLASGPNCGFTDIVEDFNNYGYYGAFDGTNFIVRVRLGSFAPNAKGYTVLIDTDGLFGPGQDPNATAENPGFELAVFLMSKHGVYVTDVDGANNCAGPTTSFPLSTHHQKSISSLTTCGDTDVFYDFYVPLSAMGVTTSQPLRMVATTNTSNTCALEGSVSDIQGVPESTCVPCTYIDIIDQFPPTPIDSLCDTCGGFPPVLSDCPEFNNAFLLEGATSFTGKGEANQTIYIEVHYGPSYTDIEYDTVLADGSGNWTSAALDSVLSEGDSILISGLTPGKSPTKYPCSDLVVLSASSDCTPGWTSTPTLAKNGYCAGVGVGVPGATVNVYLNGTLLTPANAPVIVAPDGSFNWDCGSRSGCSGGGGGCMANGLYTITQVLPGQCESPGFSSCYGISGASTPPVVNQPIAASDTEISGTAAPNAYVEYYVAPNSFFTYADGAGNWTISNLNLYSLACTNLQFYTASSGTCWSAIVNVPVSDRIDTAVTPILNCTSVAGDITVSGLVPGAPAGDTVFVFVVDASAGGTLVRDTFLVNESSGFIDSLSIVLGAGDQIYAQHGLVSCTPAVGAASDACTIPDTTARPSINCSLAYREGDLSVQGSYTVGGATIRLYIDGDSIGTVVTSGPGAWTINVASDALYAGGKLTATAELAPDEESFHSDFCTVECLPPATNLTLVNNGANELCNTIDTLFFSVLSTESLVIYEPWDIIGDSAIGPAALGTGGDINLYASPLTTNPAKISVKVIKFSSTPCSFTMEDTVTLTVNPLPIRTLSVGPADTTICRNEAVGIRVLSSQLDVLYYLTDSSTGAVIGDSVLGTGGTITLNSGAIFDTTTIIVNAVDTTKVTNCSVELDNVAHVNIIPTPNTALAVTTDDLVVNVNGATNVNVTTENNALFTYQVKRISDNSNVGASFVGDGLVHVVGTGNLLVSDSFYVQLTTPSCVFEMEDTVPVFVNQAPIAVDDYVSTAENTTLIINVQANDTDANAPGDTLLTSIISGPTSGGIISVINGDSLSYTPPLNFVGKDTVVYAICDTSGLCDTAIVYIDVLLDTDNDGIADVTDLDDDNDGIPDVVENYSGDSDGDGIVDYEDPDFCATHFQGVNGWDCNTDGLPDFGDDLDGDGTPNYMDPDFFNCGSLENGVCSNYDVDGDGVPNHTDLDSDNDGIPDLVEAGGTDTNGDGRVDNTSDLDGDGLVDALDNDDTDGPEGSSPCSPQSSCLLTSSTSLLLDTNNDGTTDNNNDTDGDGIPNQMDLDSDNDGIADVVEAGGTDTDGDGYIDSYIDADGDGFNDVVDGDVGNDGIAENSANALVLTGADTDNDGAPNSYLDGDTDGDGILDQMDLDSDNDGIADVVEAGGTDTDGDGYIDSYIDVDGDGFNDVVDGDVGNDGTAENSGNVLVLTGADTDNDGAPNSYPDGDTDGDGILDQMDLDSDNDGIADVVEAGGTDTDGDGYIDSYIDVDGDGFNDVVDGDVGNDGTAENSGNVLVLTGADTDNDGAPNSYPNGDFDGDGILNQLDLDADNDGILDITEVGGVDANNDGMADAYVDVDGDGFNDAVDGDVGNDGVAENSANALTLTGADTDNDGTPNSYPNDNADGDNNLNFLDIDSDNDGIVDNVEGQATGNYIAPAGTDADNDGIDDAYDNDDAAFGGAGSGITPNNQDKVDAPDYLDLDSDNDGLIDAIEGHDSDGDGIADAGSLANTGLPGGTTDADGDGLLDGYDNNTSSSDATNGSLTANSHPDVINKMTIERDWREGNTTYITNDVNSTPLGMTATGNVLTNDFDLEGNSLLLNTLTIDTDGDGIPETVTGLGTGVTVGGVNEDGTPNANAGTLTQNTDGTYTFVPNTGFIGEVTYTYEACDDGSPQVCGTATVTIDVEPDPSTDNGEVAPAPDVNTTYGALAVNGNVLANDNDPDGDNLLVTGTINIDTDGDGVVDGTAPVGSSTAVAGVALDGSPVTNAGTLTQNANGTYTFIPAADFVGTVNYEYTVCDDGIPMTCELTTVTINVLPQLYNSTNAIDDEEFMDKGSTLNANVLDNDSDVEGDVQTVSLVNGPSQGSLTLNANGSYSYTPTDPNYSGTDKFVYSVCDNGIPQVCDTATVYLTILNVNKDYSETGVYGIAWHRAIRDANADNTLDGTTDVWLGSQTDFETGTLALDNFDDGISFGSGAGQFPTQVIANQTFNLDITVNSSVADNVFYGLWIDWNNDGVYDDFYNGSVATASPTTTTVAITVPASYNGSETVNVRLRADDDAFAIGDFAGGRTNGEVEDYQALVIDLPVELLDFTANLEGKNIGNLAWSTATELNNAGYEVEHAFSNTGGVLEFNQIGFVTGAGTTNLTQYYNYKVPNLTSGIHYFRLKQVDYDGTYAYSPIRALEVSLPLVEQLFPTLLSKGNNRVYIQVRNSDHYQIEVITELGQIVETHKAQIDANTFYELGLEMSNYTSGMYIIRVSSGADNHSVYKIRIE